MFLAENAERTGGGDSELRDIYSLH